MSDVARPVTSREILRSVGVWLLLVTLLLGLDATVIFVTQYKIAERNVRLVRDSRVQRIRHQGRIYTQDGIASYLRRQPYYLALPHLTGALLLAGCLLLCFRRPRLAMAAALGVVALGAPAALALLAEIRAQHLLFYLFLLLLLLLGLKSAWSLPSRTS